jgi:hypothetical protein
MDVRVYRSRVSTYRHHANDPSKAVSSTAHHILLVTLKDNSTWAVDVAGLQHGQDDPVLLFADYERTTIAEVVGTRPIGSSAKDIDIPILARNPGNMNLVEQLKGAFNHLIDELAEWEHHNFPVQKLLKPSHQKVQFQLVEHLTTQAREYVKLIRGDPRSTAKLIPDTKDGWDDMSVEEKARVERKIDRKRVAMAKEARKLEEEQGWRLMM